jgi:hypothetical protein
MRTEVELETFMEEWDRLNSDQPDS